MNLLEIFKELSKSALFLKIFVKNLIIILGYRETNNLFPNLTRVNYKISLKMDERMSKSIKKLKREGGGD
jgi:hypothetical protein